MNRLATSLIGATLLAAGEAAACSCAPPQSPQAFIDGHDHIFSGQVLSGSLIDGQPGAAFGIGSAGGVVHVSRVYKGDVGPVALIRSALQSATCGVPITVGAHVTVFSTRGPNGTYPLSLCSQLPFEQDRTNIQAALDALTPAPQPMRIEGPVELNQRLRLVPVPAE